MQSPFSGLALVARPVKAKEIASDAAAKAAMDAEWASLRAMKTWEENKVREWSDVRDESRRSNTRNHVGMCSESAVKKVPSCQGETQPQIQWTLRLPRQHRPS